MSKGGKNSAKNLGSSKNTAQKRAPAPAEKSGGAGLRQPLIVGIGASAGGLNAFKGFFGSMPQDSGMAFVLVQHLAPDHQSMLSDLIGRATPMKVEEARDGIPVSANSVYVIPPNATLTIESGHLRVARPAPPRDQRRPIDTFFSSLAEDQGEHAVCIVLSGTGSDGALGVSAIKESGGFTLAQAEYDHSAMDGMPHSAVATGSVDEVLKVEDMPARLLSHQQHLKSVASRKEADGTRGDAGEHLAKIARLMRSKIGHDFSQYKEKTLTRRIQRRMQVLQIDTIPDYIARLGEEPQQVELLFRELLISVTQFFRDPQAFDALAAVFPKFLAGKGAADTIRIWVPGCATGEEVYSIAIVVKEAMEKLGVAPRVQLFGTDIDEKAVARARAGCYEKTIGVSPERVRRWFAEDGGGFCPVKDIRDMCVFSVQSVVKDPPFSRLDLISCRNLLIYMDPPLQDRVLRTFHYALKADGFLFLGPSEGVTRHARLFAGFDKKNRLFQRRDAEAVLPDLKPGASTGEALPRATEAVPPAREDQVARKARHTMEKYSPAFLVINSDFDIVRFSGGEAGRYLEPSSGAASFNLFAILRKALRPVVRAALRSAVATKQAVVQENVAVRIDGAHRSVSVIVEPLLGESELCVVAFRDMGASGADQRPNNADAAATQAVEHELRTVRTQLQSTIDELETASEEMKSAAEEYQSVNEELQSSNEELETSKEEMQSINEELQTVNAEMASKNDTLTRLNSDFRNLLDSTEMATLFLDGDMRIKSFTPPMTDIFHLRETDRGRPITDIVTLLNYIELKRDVAEVIRKLSMVEREVLLEEQGLAFILRIRPYRTVDNVIEGVVMTFMDISERKRAEDRTALLLGELDHRVKNILAIVSSVIKQTLKSSNGDSAAFAASMEGRIAAIAGAHSLLTRDGGHGEASLGDLVERELAPYRRGRNLEIGGPGVMLTPKAGLSLALVFHELASNASKYGALSDPAGRLAVTWTIVGGATDPRLALVWEETGIAPVSKPQRKGFGTTLIERTLSHDLDGKVSRDFRPSGLRCALEIPIVADIGYLPRSGPGKSP